MSPLARAPPSRTSWPDPPPARVRGGNGRFVAVSPASLLGARRCGWCSTRATSQWRVGPPDGSPAMSTLCNACGINYRRALAKRAPGARLDLDRLAGAVAGPARPSIQKALKRLRAREEIARMRARERPVGDGRRWKGEMPGSPVSPAGVRAGRGGRDWSPTPMATARRTALPPMRMPVLPPIATLLQGVGEGPIGEMQPSWSGGVDGGAYYDFSGVP